MHNETNILIEDSKDGFKIVKVKIDNKFKYIGSKYNTKDLLEQFKEKITDLKGDEYFVIFGLGSGEHIKLIRQMYKNNYIFIFEPNEKLIELYQVDDNYMWLREDVNIEVNLYEYTKLSSRIKARVLDEDMKKVFYHECYGYKTIYPAQYVDYYKDIKNVTDEKIRNLNTKIYYSRLWFNNFVGNLRYYFEGRPVNDYFGKYKDKPAIILSAGPSFDNNIDELKGIENDFLVIGGGRNLRACMENEIKLDFLSIIDPVQESYDIVKGYIDKCKVPLIFYEGTNTKAVKAHNDKKIFYAQSDFINKITNKDIANIGVGGSVAHIITNFAINIGCNPIIFIGQDFAFSNDKLHSDSTATEGKDSSIQTKNMLEVDAFGGVGKVSTNEYLDLYRRQMEELIKQNQDIKFINCSQGGARINGTEEMGLSEVREKYSSEITHPIFEESKTISKESCLYILEETINECKEIIRVSINGKSYLSDFRIACLSKDIFKSNKLENRINESKEVISKIFNENYIIYKWLYPIFLWAMNNKDVSSAEDIANINKFKENNEKLYSALIENCKQMINLLEKEVEDIKNH